MAIDNYTDQPPTYKDIALDLAARGWSVFPLGPKSKDPDGQLAPNGFKNATTDSNQIRAWWSARPAANIGIATGAKSGIIVLDLDDEQALVEATRRGLPPTVSARTSQGYHVYFKYPGQKVKNRVKFLPGMDFRGDGGYVVAPPSVHPSGVSYIWEASPDQAPIADLPPWLLEALYEKPSTPLATTSPSISTTNDPGALALLTACLTDVREALEGQRNDILNHAAYTLGGLIGAGRLARTETETALLDAARACGLGEREALATISSGLNAGAAVPLPSRGRPPLRVLTKTSPTSASTPPPLDSAFVWECFHQQEFGDAQLLAHLYTNRLIYDHAEKAWYFFDGHWHKDRSDLAKRAIPSTVASQYLDLAASLTRQAESETDEESAKRLRSQADALITRARQLRFVSRAKHVLEFAEGMLSLPALWDAHPDLLGVSNGVVDLTTGQSRAGEPADYIRTVAPTIWEGLNTSAPRFERFIREILAEDEVDVKPERSPYLQRLLGYGITGHTIEHVLPILVGEEGRNGKDTLLETIGAVMGPLAGAVSTEALLAGGRQTPGAASPHLMDLQGKRIVWTSETNEGARLNAGQVKLITGGGRIKARPLYGHPVEFEPTHLALLITNHPPHAPADDNALWSRISKIEFTRRFVDNPEAANERRRDPHLRAALKAEASGILAWLVRGCLEWRKIGLNPPHSVHLATELYRLGEDDLARFVAERCIHNDNARAGGNALYEAYKAWADDNGLSPMTGTAFGRKMSKKYRKETIEGRVFYFGLGIRA